MELTEIPEINESEARNLLIRIANEKKAGSNPSDSCPLVSLKTGEFFFASWAMTLDDNEDEWRRI